MVSRALLWCAVLLVLPAQPALAQWAPGGIWVGPGDNQEICSDGQGGFFVGWVDTRTFAATSYDVFAQHMTGAGLLASGFPTSGLPVCTNPYEQYFAAITSDGMGGAIFSWIDGRNAAIGWTLYAQRMLADGTIAPGWPADGVLLSPTAEDFSSPAVVGDGSGGAFLAWSEYRNGDVPRLFAQHVLFSGLRDPAWPDSGVPFSPYTGLQGDPVFVNVSSSGLTVVWNDDRPNASGAYIQHLDTSGVPALGWPAGGVLMWPHFCDFTSDGSGGAYALAWGYYTEYPGIGFAGLTANRFDASGQIVHGWPPGGVTVRNAPHYGQDDLITSDSSGRLFIVWNDYRDNAMFGPGWVYGSVLLPDGTLAPGWTVGGTKLSSVPYPEPDDALCADGAGGMYIGFNDASGQFAYVQHMGAGGRPAAGWDDAGVLLNTRQGQTDVKLLPDGQGGAFAVWLAGNIYAQRFLMDGVVATQLSLVSADAGPDRVMLIWESPSAQGMDATVWRRSVTTAWQSLGSPKLQAPDRLSFVDQTVVPGTRYDYRLGYSQGGIEQFTAETWVDVPMAAVLALDGARPNPAVREINVSFSLRDESAATLAVLDVAGRAVAMREVGSLGAGQHAMTFDLGGHPTPGIYWLRLKQGGHALLTRVAVIR